MPIKAFSLFYHNYSIAYLVQVPLSILTGPDSNGNHPVEYDYFSLVQGCLSRKNACSCKKVIITYCKYDIVFCILDREKEGPLACRECGCQGHGRTYAIRCSVCNKEKWPVLDISPSKDWVCSLCLSRDGGRRRNRGRKGSRNSHKATGATEEWGTQGFTWVGAI